MVSTATILWGNKIVQFKKSQYRGGGGGGVGEDLKLVSSFFLKFLSWPDFLAF